MIDFEDISTTLPIPNSHYLQWGTHNIQSVTEKHEPAILDSSLTYIESFIGGVRVTTLG